MLTITGREHHLGGPAQQFNVPTIEEIAHALALINRFTGHAKRPYSVAEHSLLVATIAASEGATPVQQLAALLHDAHEAYVGDLASPAKWVIGQPWEAFEHTHEVAVQKALGIRIAMVEHRASIKRWDLIALATERRDLLNWTPDTCTPWHILDTPEHLVLPFHGTDLARWDRWGVSWSTWRDDFLDEYERLEHLVRTAGKVTYG
jgi:hypothetical protein